MCMIYISLFVVCLFCCQMSGGERAAHAMLCSVVFIARDRLESAQKTRLLVHTPYIAVALLGTVMVNGGEAAAVPHLRRQLYTSGRLQRWRLVRALAAAAACCLPGSPTLYNS